MTGSLKRQQAKRKCLRCSSIRQEIIWERHHGAGSVVSFLLRNKILFF